MKRFALFLSLHSDMNFAFVEPAADNFSSDFFGFRQKGE